MTSDLKEAVDIILAVEKRILSTVNNRVSNIEARLIPLETKMRRIDENVFAIREELDIALSAIDNNSVQLIEHHKRIGRLEKRFA